MSEVLSLKIPDFKQFWEVLMFEKLKTRPKFRDINVPQRSNSFTHCTTKVMVNKTRLLIYSPSLVMKT